MAKGEGRYTHKSNTKGGGTNEKVVKDAEKKEDATAGSPPSGKDAPSVGKEGSDPGPKPGESSSEGLHDRHSREVTEMHKRHASEMTDMHGRHSKEHKELYGRHSKDIGPNEAPGEGAAQASAEASAGTPPKLGKAEAEGDGTFS